MVRKTISKEDKSGHNKQQNTASNLNTILNTMYASESIGDKNIGNFTVS